MPEVLTNNYTLGKVQFSPLLSRACCGTAGRTLQKSCCFGGFEVLVTWQRPQPFARDLLKSHKKAGFSVVLENNPSLVFISIELLHTIYCLCFTVYAFDLLFCYQVTFCALVYFMWVFVLSQFPSHTVHKVR
jgi:hypothetical protein